MSPRSLSLRALVCAAALALAGGCGHSTSPTGPGTDGSATAPPTITCPTDITDAVTQAPLPLTYAPPAIAGGSAPVATSCTIASGAPFPSGTSDVICTATDSLDRRAQCVFHVDVVVTPTLEGTRFMAFGDSLTWGEVAQTVTSVHVYDPVHSYPTVLATLLTNRYAPQAAQIVVDNAGAQGESAAAGEQRLVSALSARPADVLMLLEGTNDVNSGVSPETIVQSLRADVARARARGVALVLLATLPPEIEGRFRATNPDGIEPVNDLIRAVAAQEGAVLVDVYAAVAPQASLLVGDDGLHATSDGYAVIANTFLAAVAANFEQLPQASPQRLRRATQAATLGGPRTPKRPSAAP